MSLAVCSGSAANKTLALNNGTFVNYTQPWAVLVNETATPGIGDLLTWNIGVRECEDYDGCFGIAHSTGTCVCYASAAANATAATNPSDDHDRDHRDHDHD